VRTALNSNRTLNSPDGTVATKTVSSLGPIERGLHKVQQNVSSINPNFKIDPEAWLTVQVESLHAVSHFEDPSCTTLEYARDFGNSIHESLKRTCKWSA